jgi:hypothetical protein
MFDNIVTAVGSRMARHNWPRLLVFARIPRKRGDGPASVSWSLATVSYPQQSLYLTRGGA